jgi:hypothetical protein
MRVVVRWTIALGLLAETANPAWADVWTLYRSSVIDPTMRIYVGTFDAREARLA